MIATCPLCGGPTDDLTVHYVYHHAGSADDDARQRRATRLANQRAHKRRDHHTARRNR